MEMQTNGTTLHVSGRVDAVAAPELRQLLLDLVQAHHGENVTADLAQVDFIDSAGLACLVQGMKQARQHHGDLKLVAPESSEAFRVFELTRFDRVFEFVTSTPAERKAA